MDFTVAVYGNGDLYGECFNAIAAVFGANSFDTLLRIATCLAVFTIIFSFTLRRDLSLVIKWFALFYLVVCVLFVPKATVHVIDRLNNSDHPADHVPLGLALVSSYSSLIGDGITELLELNFSLPDDLRYNHTGMVMASRLVITANQFQILDSDFNEHMNEFMNSCVFYDLLMHRYSLDRLLAAENTWEFIKNNTSKANAFGYDGFIVTCREGAEKLGTRWNEIIDTVASTYGTRLFSESKEPALILKTKLTKSYNFLLNASLSSETIFTQHLMKNAIERGVVHMGGSLDATAALQAYSVTRANDQLRATFNNIGELLADWLPKFKNAIEIVAYALFIFVVLFSVFPSGINVLKNYIKTLLWIQLWPPLFAIINLIVSFYARSNSVNITNQCLHIHDIPAILQANSDMVSIAGYLSLLVPGISWRILNQMHGMFESIAHGFGGYLQSSVATGVAEATSGNFSFGNTSFGNHNSSNTTKFHWDSSGRFSSGNMQTQLENGASILNTPSGRGVADMRGAISNIGTDVDLGGSLRDARLKVADSSTQTAFSQTRESGKNFNDSLKYLYQFDNTISKSSASGDAWTSSSNTNAIEAYRESMQQTNRFAHDNKISFGKAARLLSAANAELKAGGSIGIGIPGTKFGASVGGGVSRGYSGQNSSHHDDTELFDKAKNFIRDSGYSHNIDTVERAIHDKHLRTNNEDANRLLDHSGSSYDEGHSYRELASNNLTQAKSLRESASHSYEEAKAYRISLGQQLAEYISKQPHPSGDGAITLARLGDVTGDPHLMKRYAENFFQENLNNLSMHPNHELPRKSDIQHQYNQNNHKLSGQEKIDEFYQHDRKSVAGLAKDHLDDAKIDYERKPIVEGQIADARKFLHQAKDKMSGIEQGYAEMYKNEKHRKRSEEHPVDSMINGIDTKNYDE